MEIDGIKSHIIDSLNCKSSWIVVTGLSVLIDLGSPTVVTSENLDSSSSFNIF